MPGRRAPAPVRFWLKVQFTEHCWIWTSGTKGNGYGVFWDGERQVCAHRYAYAYEYGPIPDGLEVDHLCHVRACVRPDHLRAVDHATNMKFGQPALAVRCKRGHLYDGCRAPNGRRLCVECRRERERAQYAAGRRGQRNGR